MSKPNPERKKSFFGSPACEALILLGACGAVVGEFSLVAGSGPHREAVVVEGTAPVPATKSRLGETDSTTLEPGTAMVVECRLPETGMVDAKEDRPPMLYEIPPEFIVSPDHLRSALNPETPTAVWVGTLTICGQE